MVSDDLPVLTGPVSGGRGRPFGSPVEDLAGWGYLLEEFLLEGTARALHPVPGSAPGIDGRWEVEPADPAFYRTRLYVVRPADAAAFSGVVVVNWQNVTAGIDLGLPPREIYRAGHAWVGVTAQRVAVTGQPARPGGFSATLGLPAADPERYGTLEHPGDAWSYGIFTHALRAVGPDRSGPVDPLGGLRPRTLIASGGSQSAIRLTSYLNTAQQRERVADGYLLIGHWGMGALPPDQSLQECFAPVGNGLTGGSARIRDDVGVPVLALCSETETLHNAAVRQPDTDTFRFWEMAGTAHATGGGFDVMVAAADGLAFGADAAAGLNPNTVPWDYVADAALRHLVAWVQEGTAPPSFPPIDVDPGPPPAIRRDELGAATGGLRLPDVAVPSGRHRGSNPGSPLAALSGESVPFTAEELAALYPDPDAYIRAWDAAVDALVAAGLDLGPDLDALRARGRSTAPVTTGT